MTVDVELDLFSLATSVLLIGRRENSDPFCSESAPAVCQELLRSDTNVCSKECIKSMCPVSCGKCSTYNFKNNMNNMRN